MKSLLKEFSHYLLGSAVIFLLAHIFGWLKWLPGNAILALKLCAGLPFLLKLTLAFAEGEKVSMKKYGMFILAIPIFAVYLFWVKPATVEAFIDATINYLFGFFVALLSISVFVLTVEVEKIPTETIRERALFSVLPAVVSPLILMGVLQLVI